MPHVGFWYLGLGLIFFLSGCGRPGGEAAPDSLTQRGKATDKCTTTVTYYGVARWSGIAWHRYIGKRTTVKCATKKPVVTDVLFDYGGSNATDLNHFVRLVNANPDGAYWNLWKIRTFEDKEKDLVADLDKDLEKALDEFTLGWQPVLVVVAQRPCALISDQMDTMIRYKSKIGEVGTLPLPDNTPHGGGP